MNAATGTAGARGAPEGSTADIIELRVELSGSGVDVVDEVSLHLYPGEVLGLVGESGSGKTTVGMALLGFVRRGGRLARGRVIVDSRELGTLDEAELRQVRGDAVTYIPQDPGTSLNPALRIGTQLTEVLDAHPGDRDQASRRGRVRETLEEVALSGDEAFLRRYPHQLSGGQQQRVAIAMAFANRPAVIVCDEPTTGLDVTTQAHVLETIRDLCRSHRVAALYISHDLAVVAELADRVAVMYAGRVVEQGSRAQIFAGPQHPYTRLLLGAVPDLAGRRAMVGIPGYAPLPGQRPAGCIFHPRCPMASDICRATFPPVARLKDGHQVRCYHHDQAAQQLAVQAASQPAARTPGEVVLDVGGVTAGYGARPVLHDITLTVARNECLAIVGESGSGKTTLARCVAGLHRRYSGEIRLGEQVLARAARQRTSQQRRQIQYIFQNPYASLNPRRTAGQTLARQIRLFGTVKRAALARRVDELLERVSLSAGAAGRYPDQLSGGERQRVAIARALAAEPTLLICDEVTSALDVSVQAAIIELLRELRDQAGLSLLFITHNLAVVRVIADRAIVMTEGRIVEAGPTAAILTDPADDYTRRLLANTPSIDAALTTPA